MKKYKKIGISGIFSFVNGILIYVLFYGTEASINKPFLDFPVLSLFIISVCLSLFLINLLFYKKNNEANIFNKRKIIGLIILGSLISFLLLFISLNILLLVTSKLWIFKISSTKFIIIISIISLINSSLIIIFQSGIYILEKNFNLEFQFNKLKNENSNLRYNAAKNEIMQLFMHNIFLDNNQDQSILSDMKIISDYLFRIKKYDLIKVEKELEIIEYLKNIIIKKYGKNIKFKYDLPLEIRNSYIPPFTLILLTENVLKHNVIDDENRVLLSFLSSENKLIVDNNIEWRQDVESPVKKGIKNIRERYSFFSDTNLEIVDCTSEFTVKMPLLYMNKNLKKYNVFD